MLKKKKKESPKLPPKINTSPNIRKFSQSSPKTLPSTPITNNKDTKPLPNPPISKKPLPPKPPSHLSSPPNSLERKPLPPTPQRRLSNPSKITEIKEKEQDLGLKVEEYTISDENNINKKKKRFKLKNLFKKKKKKIVSDGNSLEVNEKLIARQSAPPDIFTIKKI